MDRDTRGRLAHAHGRLAADALRSERTPRQTGFFAVYQNLIMSERGRLARIFAFNKRYRFRKMRPRRRDRFGTTRPPNVYLALSDQTAYILGHSRQSEMKTSEETTA